MIDSNSAATICLFTSKKDAKDRSKSKLNDPKLVQDEELSVAVLTAENKKKFSQYCLLIIPYNYGYDDQDLHRWNCRQNVQVIVWHASQYCA